MWGKYGQAKYSHVICSSNFEPAQYIVSFLGCIEQHRRLVAAVTIISSILAAQLDSQDKAISVDVEGVLPRLKL